MNGSKMSALRVSVGVSAVVSPRPVLTQSQESSITSAAAGQVSDDNANIITDDIVITGVPASVQRAQEIKRAAQIVIESITLQYPGKSTDVGISRRIDGSPTIRGAE